jgi:hypothetical protein
MQQIFQVGGQSEKTLFDTYRGEALHLHSMWEKIQRKRDLDLDTNKV